MARLPLRSPHTPFLPITEYGFISDCNSAALVARDGSIDWLSLPRFDSPAVFARLLDPRAGHFSISPVEEATARRRYRDGSLVLETIFETASGTARLVDAMAFARGQGHDDMGFDVPHEILRLVEGLTGSVEIEVEFAPRPEYGLVRPLIRLESTGARTFGGPNRLAMTSAAPLTLDGATVRARLSIAAGDHAGFALRWAPAEARELEATPHDLVEEQLQVTEAAWRSWQAHHSVYEGPHAEQVHLSSRILQGLTYRPTGAIVAAATTSLPEAAGGERNWDYRFAWIRDASLTLNALYIGACPDEAADFVSFMTSSAGATAGPDAALQIMYGIGGEHDLSERELPHLRGWRDSRPVRVGNGAWSQTQLDVYGELLDAIHLYHDRLGSLHHEIQRFVADLADAAARRWREKDAGMWEMRGEPRDHLSSKLLCWVALDRAVKLAPHLEEHSNSERWSAERDAIRQAIMNRGWSDSRGAFTQFFGSDELDASVLLMPLVGFLPVGDPRMRATIEAIARELTEDGLVLRYRNEQGVNADGLRGEEGTFVICSFWLVSCLARAGEVSRAEQLFDRLLSYSNDLGILAEEIDVATGEMLGNVPQAFSHIGLITAAAEIDHARKLSL